MKGCHAAQSPVPIDGIGRYEGPEREVVIDPRFVENDNVWAAGSLYGQGPTRFERSAESGSIYD
jgi:hypothetical protein